MCIWVQVHADIRGGGRVLGMAFAFLSFVVYVYNGRWERKKTKATLDLDVGVL